MLDTPTPPEEEPGDVQPTETEEEQSPSEDEEKDPA